VWLSVGACKDGEGEADCVPPPDWLMLGDAPPAGEAVVCAVREAPGLADASGAVPDAMAVGDRPSVPENAREAEVGGLRDASSDSVAARRGEGEVLEERVRLEQVLGEGVVQGEAEALGDSEALEDTLGLGEGEGVLDEEPPRWLGEGEPLRLPPPPPPPFVAEGVRDSEGGRVVEIEDVLEGARGVCVLPEGVPGDESEGRGGEAVLAGAVGEREGVVEREGLGQGEADKLARPLLGVALREELGLNVGQGVGVRESGRVGEAEAQGQALALLLVALFKLGEREPLRLLERVPLSVALGEGEEEAQREAVGDAEGERESLENFERDGVALGLRESPELRELEEEVLGEGVVEREEPRRGEGVAAAGRESVGVGVL
jgi:hypothetical protein